MAAKRTRKRKGVVRRRKNAKAKREVPVKLLSFLFLLGMLLFSMGVAGYVIFFQTTVAQGATGEEGTANFVFEEPYANIPELPADIPPVKDSSLPKVAIIIDDMGFNNEIGTQLLELHMNLTFSFLPSAPFTAELEEKAYQAGRCIFLHLPMEPKGKEWDPGPGALLLGQSKVEQKKLFEQNLMAVPHAVGVNNHMGSLYTENREAMENLMKLIGEQGLYFIDSFTSSASKGLLAARAAGIPSARRHIFLDNVHSRDKVCGQLQQLVLHAEKNGWAVGIGHPNEATLEALINCRGKLLDRVQLISAQELIISLYRF